MRSRIVKLVAAHGGIATVRTHRVTETDRGTGRRRRAWANTIVCRDGYRRTLTTYEERMLKAGLPEDLRAFEHIEEDA